MVLHVSLWTRDDGAPVLICQHPRDDKSVPLSVLSATNGVFSFVKHSGSLLKQIESNNLTIHWRELSEDLRLIFIRSTDEKSAYQWNPESIMDMVNLSLRMSCNEEDFVSSNDDLRWYIKPSVSRIQYLLESLDVVDCRLSDLTLLPDIVIIDNHQSIQSYLDAFTKGIGVQYASVNVFGRRAVCTQQWYLLTPVEQVILTFIGRQMSGTSSRVDMPLYIPSLSKKIPFRFILITLTHGVDIILICGSHPPLTEISAEIRRFWFPSTLALRSTLHSIPRGLPPTINLPGEVMAFALLSRAAGNPFCLSSATSLSNSAPEGDLDLARRRHVLRELISQIYNQDCVEEQEKNQGYFATSEYRAHFTQRDNYLLLVLLHKSVPLLATGSIAESTLSILQKLLPSPE